MLAASSRAAYTQHAGCWTDGNLISEFRLLLLLLLFFQS